MESKFYKWNKRGSRIIIDTGYKTFDKQIQCISTGNVISDCQLSFYIRAYNNTNCNNNIFKKGELRQVDLNCFKNLNKEVRNYIISITEDNSCILYQFNTKDENIFGYIVEQNNNFKIFNISNNNYNKKQKCLEIIKKVLEEERDIYRVGKL